MSNNTAIATSATGWFGVDSWNDRYGDSKSRSIPFKTNIFDLVAQCRHEGLNSVDIVNILSTGEPTRLVIPTAKARELSDRFRSYYENKFFTLKLQGVEMTDFRKNVIALLKHPRDIKVSQLPIVVKLFDFYEEDTMFDVLIKSSTSIELDSVPDRDTVVELVYIDSYRRSRKHYKEIQHILKYNDHMVILGEGSQVHNNSLEFLLTTLGKVNVTANWKYLQHKDQRDFNYMHAEFFEFVTK